MNYANNQEWPADHLLGSETTIDTSQSVNQASANFGNVYHKTHDDDRPLLVVTNPGPESSAGPTWCQLIQAPAPGSSGLWSGHGKDRGNRT